jgi:hypothetical protein
MKGKKFIAIRKKCEDIDTNLFYREFYDMIDTHLQDECKPAVIIELCEGAWKDSITVDKTINMVACVITLMKIVKWR